MANQALVTVIESQTKQQSNAISKAFIGGPIESI